MDENLEFLKSFPQDANGMYIVYDLYTFDNLFRLLLQEGFDHEDALYFVLGNCSLSALVFQDRLHNRRYLKLFGDEAKSPDLGASKAQFIHDLLSLAKKK